MVGYQNIFTTMKNLSDYINSLNFEYAISYSGLRGDKFSHLETSNKEKIQQLKKEIESAGILQKTKLDKSIKALESELNICNSRIIKKNKEIHKSTIQVHKFEKNDKVLKEIFGILNSKFEELRLLMCAPIFRDAIVFYSKENEIQGILQMCFSCSSIKNENEEILEVDYKIFPRLMKQLIQLGHEIEDE